MSIANYKIYDSTKGEMYKVTELSYRPDGVYIKHENSIEWINTTDTNYILQVGSGFKDINGFEIFEGDIVETIPVCPGEKDFRGVVKFYDCCFLVDNGKDAIALFDEVTPRKIVGHTN